MTRGFLMALLALDLLVMGGAGYIVWDRIKKKSDAHPEAALQMRGNPEQSPALPAQQPAATAATAVSPSSVSAAAPAPVEEPAPETEPAKPAAKDGPESRPKGPPRKMLFRYNDVAAKRVSIVGDFNQWSPKLMKKDPYGHWVITLSIPPGDYSYNFIVDGRMIRDPNNKRVKQSSQKIPSSLLSVSSGKKR